LPAGAGFLRFSPFRALAELAGFAAPAGLQIQLKQGGSLNPEMPAMLGCAYGVSNPNCLFCRSALQARLLLDIPAKVGIQSIQISG
jgi:hypothetical protein